MAGQQIINSFGAVGSVGPDEGLGEALTVAGAFRAAWQSSILPFLSNQYVFTKVTARGVRTTLLSAEVAATQGPGGVSLAALPTFVALKVRLATATPGPAGRGRTGICGIVEAATEPNQPNMVEASDRALWQTRFQNFRDALSGNTSPVALAVISRFLNNAPRADPLVSLVQDHSIPAVLGSRVSRLR
jgi:hypothetical protein